MADDDSRDPDGTRRSPAIHAAAVLPPLSTPATHWAWTCSSMDRPLLQPPVDMCIDKKSTRTQDQDYLGPNRVATIIYGPVRVLDTHGLPGLLCAKKPRLAVETGATFHGPRRTCWKQTGIYYFCRKKKNVCWVGRSSKATQAQWTAKKIRAHGS